jgi:hypothetical protein
VPIWGPDIPTTKDARPPFTLQKFLILAAHGTEAVQPNRGYEDMTTKIAGIRVFQLLLFLCFFFRALFRGRHTASRRLLNLRPYFRGSLIEGNRPQLKILGQ